MRVIGPGYTVFEGTDDLIFVVNPDESRAVSPHAADPGMLCCYERGPRGPIITLEVEFILSGWVHDYDHAEAYLRGEEPSLFVSISEVYKIGNNVETTGYGWPLDDPT